MNLSTVQRCTTKGSFDNRLITDGGDKRWKAHLDFHFQPGPQKTIVRRQHRGPLTMQRPFYPEGDTAHVYILHPPGGVVAGDELNVSVKADANSSALVSTPGATKFYRSDTGIASVTQDINCDNCSLEWLPQENIFFNGCKARLNTHIVIENGARLAWWEINCFGRSSADAPFTDGSVQNVVKITSDEIVLLLDRLIVNARHGLNLSCGMRGKSITGSLVLTPVHADTLDIVRHLSREDDCFSSTYFDGLLLVRYLGNSSEAAKNGFACIWSGLRQTLNNKPAQRPRIWAT